MSFNNSVMFWSVLYIKSNNNEFQQQKSIIMCRVICIYTYKHINISNFRCRHDHIIYGKQNGYSIFPSIFPTAALSDRCFWFYPKWHPIPFIVHYFWPGSIGLRSKIVHYIGNRVPFGTHHWSEAAVWDQEVVVNTELLMTTLFHNWSAKRLAASGPLIPSIHLSFLCCVFSSWLLQLLLTKKCEQLSFPRKLTKISQ